jgi:thiamine-monophosphate kinase
VDEFALIRRFFDRPLKDESVHLGIGDDAAVIVPDPDRELVCAVDTIVAGIHYPLDLPPFDVGYRSLAINLSDMAAMGARPRWMTLALTMPNADTGWLSLFAEGLFTAAAEAEVSLVGGDTTRGQAIVVSIHLLGDRATMSMSREHRATLPRAVRCLIAVPIRRVKANTSSAVSFARKRELHLHRRLRKLSVLQSTYLMACMLICRSC